MCEFLSAIKTKDKYGKDKYYFLTHDLIHNTPRGEMLQKKYGGDDLVGHAAIRDYFELQSGVGENWEQIDFSKPKNFPVILVKAIKRGDFRGLGEPKGLLTAPAGKAYQEATAPAGKAYQEATAPAGKAYQEATAPAGKAYQEAKDAAEKAYQEAKDAFWDLFSEPENRVEAWR
jgi:hypothetical protein